MKKSLTLIISFFILVIVFPTIVKADEKWTNFSNAKIEIIAMNDNLDTAQVIQYGIKISNVELNPNSAYSVLFHHKDDEISKSKITFDSQVIVKEGQTESKIPGLVEILVEQNEDIYVSIVEQLDYPYGDTNLVLEVQKISHPGIFNKLGNRIHTYFTSSSTKTFYFAPNCVNSVTKLGNPKTINIKVGKINDIELLKEIQNNKQNGFQKLLSYANQQIEYNYTGTINYDLDINSGITESLTPQMKLEGNAYYFVYFNIDTENGKYYPVEDIAIYRASGTNELVRYDEKDFVIEIEEPIPPIITPTENPNGQQLANNEKSPDSTQATGELPYTGVSIKLIAILILAILGTFIVYFKYNKLRDI